MTRWAGRLLVAIGVLHTLVFLPHPYWGQWLSGELWTNRSAESLAIFWALPGSFVVVGILLGLLISRLARDGYPVPGYVGWAILGWSVGCTALIGPSGFMSGSIPAILLIVAWLRQRRDARLSRDPGAPVHARP